jgi:biopolymer transport protein ExbB
VYAQDENSVASAAVSSAETNTPDASETSEETVAEVRNPRSFLAILQAGGPIGYVIILLSLIAVALMIEHAFTIRQKVFMPPGFAEEILQMLTQGQLGAALQKCKEGDCVLADVLAAGMAEYELGWNAVEKATEESLAEELARLYRKIEYLNVIGNIAPMLGLLGTVVGMIFAFQNLADSEGYARAGDLAEGIYLALVTTVQGLVVAIPSLAAYSIFSNRIAFLIAETTYVAEQVLGPIKRSFVKKKGA